MKLVHTSGDANVSYAGSRSALGFHWLVPAGNMCGNAISMVEIVSACSWPSASSSLPSGASMVSISSMFISIAPMRVLRAKIVSFAGGTARSWPSAAGLAARTQAARAPRHAAADMRLRVIGIPDDQLAACIVPAQAGTHNPAFAGTTRCDHSEDVSFEAGLFLLADVRREHFAGFAHREALQRPALLFAVAQRAEHHLHEVPGLHGIPSPSAGANEIAGAGHLHQPNGRLIFLPLLDRAVDRKADVRIDPAQFHHLPVDGERLGMVEHGRGVVRSHRRNAGGETADGRNRDCPPERLFHFSPPKSIIIPMMAC